MSTFLDWLIVALYAVAEFGTIYLIFFKFRPWLHTWLDRHLPGGKRDRE